MTVVFLARGSTGPPAAAGAGRHSPTANAGLCSLAKVVVPHGDSTEKAKILSADELEPVEGAT